MHSVNLSWMLHSAPLAVLPKNLSLTENQQSLPSFWKAAKFTHPSTERGALRKQLKFFVRAGLAPQLTREWLRRLTSSELAPLWTLRPRLASKLQRPYQCALWSPRQKLEALLAHYALFPKLVQASFRQEIYGPGCTLLCIHHLESKRELQLRLFYRDQFEKEGELTLGVVDRATETMLAGVTFSIGQRQETRTAFIGGLQASPGPQTRALIHDVAKEMHGMRPKAFALWCLQSLLQQWGVQELRAVGDDQHIYCHWRKRRQIAASYNEFWAESDGECGEAGLWSVPLIPRVRSREELKPSRRKAHERRYALLGQIETRLAAAVAVLASGAGNGSPAREALVFEYGAVDRTQGAAPAAELMGDLAENRPAPSVSA